MAKPNNFDDFCWFVVTNYDFLILKKLNLTAPFQKKTLFTAPSTWPIRRFLVIFEVRIKHSCDHTLTAGPNLMCPSSWALNSDNFPFFWTLYCSSRTRVTAVWRLVNICWNFAHTGAGSQTEPLWLKFRQISTDLLTAVTQVPDEQ